MGGGMLPVSYIRVVMRFSTVHHDDGHRVKAMDSPTSLSSFRLHLFLLSLQLGFPLINFDPSTQSTSFIPCRNREGPLRLATGFLVQLEESSSWQSTSLLFDCCYPVHITYIFTTLLIIALGCEYSARKLLTLLWNVSAPGERLFSCYTYALLSASWSSVGWKIETLRGLRVFPQNNEFNARIPKLFNNVSVLLFTYPSTYIESVTNIINNFVYQTATHPLESLHRRYLSRFTWSMAQSWPSPCQWKTSFRSLYPLQYWTATKTKRNPSMYCS